MSELGTILLDIARNKEISPRDQEFLRMEGNRMQMSMAQVASMSGVGGPSLNSPTIRNPYFATSPLSVFECHLNTDTEIANNTDTPITFEIGYGDTSVFDFYNGDLSKIRLDRSQANLHLSGVVAWEANATGKRSARLDVFDEADTLLWQPGLFTLTAVTGDFTRCPISYSVNIRAHFPSASYFQINVLQNSGAGLDVADFWLATSIA